MSEGGGRERGIETGTKDNGGVRLRRICTMTIIVFLVDTSASMNQRTYTGTTLLDVAKGAVETFMKIRSRDPNSRWDRYMLLTFEDPPANVKAGWKENHATFMKELKNLEAFGLTTLGPALKHTFDLLNINRMTSGIDTYGMGRCPFYLEPAVIICLTDGRKMTSTSGASSELNLPMNTAVPGSELTKEPFRWDQRLFGVVLRMAATPPVDAFTYIPSADDTAIDVMCEVTGGRSYTISSQRTLIQCLESLVQKCQSGVVVCFEKLPSDGLLFGSENEKNGEKRSASPSLQNQAWQNCRRLIYVPRSALRGCTGGHWPIPEAFWHDIDSPSLPPRTAHPVLKFSCNACEPVVLENLPFDKYELEPSPLTQFILERRQPNVAWQVFVGGSAKYNDMGLPFGYLKASTSLTSVNLFVMPYNYPQLVPLLDELFKVHKCKPTPKWRQQFDTYLKTMPVYYATPLKRALARMGAPNFIPEQNENCLSYAVVSYLKRLKNQAKMEYDRLVASVGQCPPSCPGIKVTPRSQTSILERADFHQLLAQHRYDLSSLKQELKDCDTFLLHAELPNSTAHAYTNPFDTQRKALLGQIARMRVNFLRIPKAGGYHLHQEENLHTAPVQDMGNYQEYLKKLPQPLREIETMPVRQHTFGNPFKVNKNIMIDEADEAMPGQSTGRKRPAADSPAASPRPNKRRPGPLPRDVTVRQLLSPLPSPTSSNSPPDGGSADLFFPIDSPITIDDESEVQQLENSMSNHIGSSLENLTNHVRDGAAETNGELEIDLSDGETITNGDGELVHRNNRTKLTDSANNFKVQECNFNLQKLAIIEVRKPGKCYDGIFKHLQSLQGSLEMRCHFIRNVMNEAARFKKQLLVSRLEELMQSLVRFSSKENLFLKSTNIAGVRSVIFDSPADL